MVKGSGRRGCRGGVIHRLPRRPSPSLGGTFRGYRTTIEPATFFEGLSRAADSKNSGCSRQIRNNTHTTSASSRRRPAPQCQSGHRAGQPHRSCGSSSGEQDYRIMEYLPLTAPQQAARRWTYRPAGARALFIAARRRKCEYSKPLKHADAVAVGIMINRRVSTGRHPAAAGLGAANAPSGPVATKMRNY